MTVIVSGTGYIEFFLTAQVEGNSQHEQTIALVGIYLLFSVENLKRLEEFSIFSWGFVSNYNTLLHFTSVTISKFCNMIIMRCLDVSFPALSLSSLSLHSLSYTHTLSPPLFPVFSLLLSSLSSLSLILSSLLSLFSPVYVCRSEH